MDTLTHALSGALIARLATPARIDPGAPGINGRMAAGFAAGAFPDIDFLLRAVDTLWYLSDVHQGATHSLVLLPLWAFVVAGVFGWISGLGWRGYYVPAALGLLIHIVGDVITAYGTMLFFPFSDWRPALSLSYVLDPYFTTILLAGLIVALRKPAAARIGCVAALLGLTVYVGFQAALQQRALALGSLHAASLGSPEARISALPQPFSPGHWMVVVSDDEVHFRAWVRVLPGRSLLDSPPIRWLPQRMSAYYRADPEWQAFPRFESADASPELVHAAWSQDGFERFRRFASLPAFEGLTVDGEQICVWFMDLRFALPGLPPSFVFGMCREHAAAPWHPQRRRGALWLD